MYQLVEMAATFLKENQQEMIGYYKVRLKLGWLPHMLFLDSIKVNGEH